MAGPTQDPYFWRKILVVAAAIALAVIAAYVTVIMPQRQEQHSGIGHGATLYAANCAGCHGPKLEGQPDWRHVNASGRLPAPPLDGTGHGWRHSNDELFHMVKFSVLDEAGPGYRTDMPAFSGKLSDDDIRAVLGYIHAQWPSGIQAAQAFLNPDHAGMPAHIDGDWRLPADCEEPDRGSRRPKPPPRLSSILPGPAATCLQRPGGLIRMPDWPYPDSPQEHSSVVSGRSDRSLLALQ